MQSNQSGECSLLCVSGLFVCWALFHSFSPVYLSMANAVVSTEVCSSLCNIPLLSIWNANHLASPKFWSALCQDWNGSLSMNVHISEAHPYSHSNGCFMFLVRESWDSDEGNAVSEQTLKKKCLKVKPHNVICAAENLQLMSQEPMVNLCLALSIWLTSPFLLIRRSSLTTLLAN